MLMLNAASVSKRDTDDTESSEETRSGCSALIFNTTDIRLVSGSKTNIDLRRLRQSLMGDNKYLKLKLKTTAR